MTIYEQTKKDALEFIQNGGKAQQATNENQRLVAENILDFLRFNGLNVVLVADGCVIDIHVQVYNAFQDSKHNGVVRVFYKSASDVIKNNKVQYLPSLITNSIVGYTREWKDFNGNDELLGLIKQEIFEVYKYKIKK